jgi:enterochelin esterase-like enzyme
MAKYASAMSIPTHPLKLSDAVISRSAGSPLQRANPLCSNLSTAVFDLSPNTLFRPFRRAKNLVLVIAFLFVAIFPTHAQTDPGTAGDGDFTLGPAYTNAPELTVRSNVPVGAIHRFTMNSTDSKFYPGISKTNPGQVVPYTRTVAVYVPKQYVSGTAAPFIVVHDGPGYVARMTKILDNMIADRRLPAMIAVFLNNGGGDSKGSERGLEYDTVSGKFAEFIEAEVLPRVEADYHVTLTKDPDGRATMGGSSGGAAALSMAWFHPELYHRVLSYSGTFVNQQSPENPESLHGAWEYHEHLIPNNPAKPLRIWLEVGEHDNGYNAPESGYHNWVIANQHMAAVLKAKGYHYHYVFCLGAGHVDAKAVNETLPDALEWLWRGYPIK